MKHFITAVLILLCLGSCKEDEADFQIDTKLSIEGVWGMTSQRTIDNHDSIAFEKLKDSDYLGKLSFGSEHVQVMFNDYLKYARYQFEEDSLTTYPDSLMDNVGQVYYFESSDSSYYLDKVKLQSLVDHENVKWVELNDTLLIESIPLIPGLHLERRYLRINDEFQDLTEEFLLN